VSEEDRAAMTLIDRQYLARPYYGSRRMAAKHTVPFFAADHPSYLR
jgi:hypothetical protein